MTTLVEACAGSAAVSRRLLGLGKIVGFMGGKDGYAEAILDVWNPPKPTKLVLNDPGIWSSIWTGVVSSRYDVAAEIRKLKGDPRTVFYYVSLISHCKPSAMTTPAQVAAAAIVRIAGTHLGAEIGGFKGRHKLRPNADGFIPRRSTLATRVERLVWPTPVIVEKTCASKLDVPHGAWVYIDPPYEGVTGYIHHLARRKLIALCLHLDRNRCRVAVSESVPLEPLVRHGWRTACLTYRRDGQRRTRTRSHGEWLTFNERSS